MINMSVTSVHTHTVLTTRVKSSGIRVNTCVGVAKAVRVLRGITGWYEGESSLLKLPQKYLFLRRIHVASE